MNALINLFKSIFTSKATFADVVVPENEFVKPFVLKPIFSAFSHYAASNGAKFQLRNGLPFKLISLSHQEPGDWRPRVLIHIEGESHPRQYYSDGNWDELDESGYDLVMVN